MEKSKKISFTSIAIVVLAILLTVSLTMGGTLAWFANQNQAGTTLTMGNAVGVAVVDNVGNGSMDRLSFQFNTGRNGELMLPGTQIDPNVQALIASSNTNTILRAVVSFEVSLDPTIAADADNRTAIATATGQTIYSEEGTDGITRWFMTVPSSVLGALNASDPGYNATIGDDDSRAALNRELYLLNQMYTSFFTTLQGSALYNGWVYRESNLFGTDASNTDSAAKASTKYYAAGYTQFANQPVEAKATRNAGPERLQNTDATDATNKFTDGSTLSAAAVSYNAFYFRGWAADGGQKTAGDAITAAGSYQGQTITAYDASSGNGWKVEDRGIDGTYVVKYQNGSKTGDTKYVPGTGTQYYPTRAKAGDIAYVDGKGINNNQYAILEGDLASGTNVITKYKDGLGFKAGDITGPESGAGTVVKKIGTLNAINDTADYGVLNVAPTVGDAELKEAKNAEGNYTKYNWATAGVQKSGEDMMCVINTLDEPQRIPLFTTSFILPTTWTQDAFADRCMKLNITFQVMQADYLASGSSHHVSVELAESRFDDVTIWAGAAGTVGAGAIVKGQPYIKDVQSQPNFDNPEFWNGDDYYRNPGYTPDGTDPTDPD
jgi:hypothetical protein